jgi:hypothetical protein
LQTLSASHSTKRPTDNEENKLNKKKRKQNYEQVRVVSRQTQWLVAHTQFAKDSSLFLRIAL